MQDGLQKGGKTLFVKNWQMTVDTLEVKNFIKILHHFSDKRVLHRNSNSQPKMVGKQFF